MNEPPVKRTTFLDRIRSLPLKAWVVILVIESLIFLALVVVLVVVVFGK